MTVKILGYHHWYAGKLEMLRMDIISGIGENLLYFHSAHIEMLKQEDLLLHIPSLDDKLDPYNKE